MRPFLQRAFSGIGSGLVVEMPSQFGLRSTKNSLNYIRICAMFICKLAIAFGILRVMEAIISLVCKWWKNMHQIDAYPKVHCITYPQPVRF